MAIYSLAVRTTNTTINNAAFEIRTTASVRATVYEIGIVQVTGTASSYGLGRPAAIGVTPTSPVTVLAEDSGAPTGNTTTALAWGTSPTAPTAYLRRWNSAATVGVGITWTFPRGLIIPVSSSLVVFNITATVACDMWVVLDE